MAQHTSEKLEIVDQRELFVPETCDIQYFSWYEPQSTLHHRAGVTPRLYQPVGRLHVSPDTLRIQSKRPQVVAVKAAPFAGRDRGFGSREARYLEFDAVAFQQVIGIKKLDILSVRFGESAIRGCRLPHICLMDYLDTRSTQALQYLRCPIS